MWINTKKKKNVQNGRNALKYAIIMKYASIRQICIYMRNILNSSGTSTDISSSNAGKQYVYVHFFSDMVSDSN